MKLKIVHTTDYSYADKVFFEPHYLRFKPKLSTHFSVSDFSIAVEPNPAGMSEQIDCENNHMFLCWFEGTHKNLKIETEILVDVREFNPFNFLIYPPEYAKLPFDYDKKTKKLLKPALKTGSLTEPMKQFLENVITETDHQTVPFLTELTKQVHQNFNVENRETGAPHRPEYTFSEKKGSCRDLAWMQIHLLRSLGIASRFASGYLYLDGNDPSFELHAWVEVYIPGAGWRGFDPSHGLLAGQYHIPVASSSFFSNTMPVSGTIRGSAKNKLSSQLSMTLVS
jgi:transglutaminase-like putative cysteine protease